VSTRSFSCSPANRPAPWRWTSSLVGQAARRRRSLCACDAAAQIRHRPSCGPPTANPAPSLASDPCGQATTPPADHGDTSNPLPQRGRPAAPSHSTGQRGPDSAAAEPRTPETRPSGHLHGTGRVDTGRVDTGRPLDRLDTDVRTADRGRGQGDDRRSRRPDILATGDQPLGSQTSPRSQRLVALGQP
jgi:hypothetical protein